MSASNETPSAGNRRDDGIVILTLDDPNQSANTMNAAFAESLKATVARLQAEKDRDHGRGHHLGEEDLLRRRRPQRPEARHAERAKEFTTFLRELRRGCERSRRSAGRSSRRSMEPRSAGVWRSRSATHHRVIVDDRKAVDGLPGGRARPASGRRRRHPDRAHDRHRPGADGRASCRASGFGRREAKELGLSTRSSRPGKI